MSEISEVHYQEIDTNICNINEAGEFYFLHNLLDTTNMFHKDYETYESKQLQLKKEIIGQLRIDNKISDSSNINSSILGISSLKNKVVIIV